MLSLIAQTESDEQMKRMLLSRPPKVRFAVLLGELDFADHFALRVEHMDAVERAGIDIAPLVEPHSIGEAGVDDREDALVGDGLAVRCDIERIDRVRLIVIIGARSLDRAAVDDVENFLVRRKRDAVGHLEVARDNSELFRGGIVAVDIVRELGFLRELERAVAGIGEPHGAVGFHHEVVRGIQRLAVVGTRECLHAAVMVRDGNAAAGGLGGEQARLEVGGLAIGDAGRMAENDRLAPGGGRDGIVGRETVPADEVDVVVDLVGEDEIALRRVFHLQVNRPFGEAEALGEVDEFRLGAEDFGELVVVDLERKLRILLLGVGRVFLVGESADFDFLGRGVDREGDSSSKA